MLLKIIKVFPYKRSGNNFVGFERNLEADKNNVRTKDYGLFTSYNPKNTIICEAQAIKAGFVSNFCKTEWRKKQNGCSSEKERKVNALALRADEGRDNLR